MPVPFQISKTSSVGGKTFSEQVTVNPGQALILEESIPTAKAGTLTTRTDADTGEATLGSGHGITDGDRVDVYWDGGSRRGMTVGTVAGLVVPIDGGAGDDLPTQSTVINVAVAQEYKFVVDGDDLLALAASSPFRATFVLADGSDAEEFAIVLKKDAAAYQWFDGDIEVNPIAGDSVAKVFISHNNTAAAQLLKIAAGI